MESARASASRTRRALILRCALRSFVAKGYPATTIDDIRVAAQVSVGSLYHHFGSKEAVAAAVFMDGIADYQSTLRAVLDREQDARAGVQALVQAHVAWLAENRDLGAFLFAARPADFIDDRGAELADRNSDFAGFCLDWLQHHVDDGRIQPMARQAYLSVWLGPIHQYARSHPVDQAAADDLARAAWRALRADGGIPRSGRRAR